jgi:hypothetical protein
VAAGDIPTVTFALGRGFYSSSSASRLQIDAIIDFRILVCLNIIMLTKADLHTDAESAAFMGHRIERPPSSITSCSSSTMSGFLFVVSPSENHS